MLGLFAFSAIGGCHEKRTEVPPSATESAEIDKIADAPPPREEPELVILISVDTLRADHLGLYGHHRFTSPSIDLFGQEGTVFEDASSVAPWTLPAHASMLTGRYPLSHRVVDVDRKLPDEIPTLSRLLGDAGWTTAAAVNSTWLLKKNHEVTRDFDHFLFVQDVADERLPTIAITEQALAWVRNHGDSDLFIFMHYYDVHSDYTSTPSYENLMVSDYAGEVDGTTWQLNIASMPDIYIEKCQEKVFAKDKCKFGASEPPQYVDSSVRKIEFQDDDLKHLEELYDAGIRQLDSELRRFFEGLESQDRLGSARIILTSDHGEEFSEHGSFYHFVTTYQEILHVPLIFRGRGIAAQRRIEAPVSIVDIVPTILGWANIPVPPSIEGIDLDPFLSPSSTEASTRSTEETMMKRFQYAEASGGIQWERTAKGLVPAFSSIRQGNYKWIDRSEGWEPALYDLASDPGEKNDISQLKPGIAKLLADTLAGRRAALDSQGSEENIIEVDPDEADRLRALGYIIDD